MFWTYRDLKYNPWSTTAIKILYILEGEDLQNENPIKAIEMFEQVVDLETKLGDDVTWFVNNWYVIDLI